ncbi:hypothetical protein [Ruegeria arenilitoris]|uniref:hypothetical protein n=2 Tax=Ruegeria TaxID=97050 RepID=UPI00147F1BAC|nr:hypothetical protein [Ruegeria arenilitoris]
MTNLVTHPTIKEPSKRKADLSLRNINRTRRKRNEESVGDYLNIGLLLSETASQFQSTRKYGEFLKSEFPELIKSMDSPLRSACKWLYEAIYVPGSEGSDILEVLDIDDIADFRSSHPTVIKREYRKALKAKKGVRNDNALSADEDKSQTGVTAAPNAAPPKR